MQFQRHRRRGAQDHSEAREVALAETGRLGHVVDHRRDAQEERRPHCSISSSAGSVRNRRTRMAVPPTTNIPEHAVDQAPAMKQRRGHQETVLGSVMDRCESQGIVDDITVREHDALGVSRRSRGVKQVGQRVGW